MNYSRGKESSELGDQRKVPRINLASLPELKSNPGLNRSVQGVSTKPERKEVSPLLQYRQKWFGHQYNPKLKTQ